MTARSEDSPKVSYVVWGKPRRDRESATDRFCDLPPKLQDQVLDDCLDWLGITARPMMDGSVPWLKDFLGKELGPEFVSAVLEIMGERAAKTHRREGKTSIYAEAAE